MLGKLLGKIVTAPIKIVAMPFKVIEDLVDDNSDEPVKTVTDSIERQLKDIID